MHETLKKGELAFLKCSIRALEKGAILSRPTTDARYDAVLDLDGKLLRAQVKYGGGKSTNSSNACTVNLSHRGRRYLRDEIDVLLVYVPATDKVLLFEHDHFHGRREITIRFGVSKNGQEKGIRPADKFAW